VFPDVTKNERENNVGTESAAPQVAVIFCTKNSEDTIESAISKVKQSQYNPDIIVVDGFSEDKTVEIAKNMESTVVLEQPVKKFPGKGIAMKAGLEEALNHKYSNHDNSDIKNNNTNGKYDCALFLDSDIRNLSSGWVDRLVEPVLKGRYSVTRGFYDRHPRDAAVTKLIARPLLEVFFPELSNSKQPLSGEVCANMEVWSSLLMGSDGNRPPDGWGIDIWFLVESAMSNHRIEEIYLGSKDHGSLDGYKDDVGNLRMMAEQVCLTIIDQAIKHGRLDRYKKVNL
jgi:glucosyl-3-phosphoglycerate synthase